jgi:hypothetical protein
VMGPGCTGMVSVAWRILRGASVRSTESVMGAPGTPVWALAESVAAQTAARGRRRNNDMIRDSSEQVLGGFKCTRVPDRDVTPIV